MLYGPELEEVANQALEEYELHIKGVRSAFNGFIYEYNAVDKPQNDVANDIARMLRIRYKNNAPRRPPRVIILGPPGSGRSTQAEVISRRYGLVHVCTRTLLKHEISRNPEVGKMLSAALDAGQLVPDQIVLPLVEQRLKQSDCRVNGWILDGFPQTDAQINLLKSLKIRPSLVCLLEQPVDESVRRLNNRRIDPHTGTYYNLEINPPKEEQVATRLIEMHEDREQVIRSRFEIWNGQVSNIEEAYKSMLLNVPSDKPVEQVTEFICEAI